MPTNTGLAAQLAVSEETTYGTLVAPTRGVEFDTEKIIATIKKVYGKALRTVRLQRQDRTRTYVVGATGAVEIEVLTKGFGLFLKYMLGAVASSQPDPINKPTEYLHSFTQSDVGLYGHSLTLQVGRPSALGTVIPFTYFGCKVTDWTLETSTDNPLKATLTFDAKGEDLITALAATPTYPTSAELLTFIDGTVTVGGTSLYVTKAMVTGKNGLKTDRVGLGVVKREPVTDAEMAITGELDMDFEGTTYHAQMLSGAVAAVVLNFSFGEIDAGKANPYMLKITIPAVELTGDPPTVTGPSVVPHVLKFKALYDGTDPIITVDYHTTDVTP